MRKIGIKEIEDIALGAALLGSGGGGDPYVENWWPWAPSRSAAR